MTTLDATIAAVQAMIDGIEANGLANGTVYVNTAMPATSHVRVNLQWPLNDDGSPRSLIDHICRYGSFHLDTAARDAVADKADAETSVIVAIARLAAWRFYGWTQNTLNRAEINSIAQTEAPLAVNADHEVVVKNALNEFSTFAPRLMGLVYYNSISYETCNHHHLPAVTKKLAGTTITLSGLKEWMAGNADREGAVFHDMFHMVSDEEKSRCARRVSARNHLSNLRFDNLRKRLPVKAADSGVAVNYATLLAKARAYKHVEVHLPPGLNPPPELAAAIADYENAATADELQAVVTKLRLMSEDLGEASAYVAGFILGMERRATNDVDLDLRTAARQTTILGAPAYQRLAGEYAGTFAHGSTVGYAPVPAGTPDHVMTRVAAGVANVATH